MDWLETNIDGYRTLCEILREFRTHLAATLHAAHGDEWVEHGIPEATRDVLGERQENERAIDWYETGHQELLNYATFDDFLQILLADEGIFPAITALAPNQPLLHTRFLELEVMRRKIGRARPISEAELSFLGSFHLRLRKALENNAENTETAIAERRDAISDDETVGDRPEATDEVADAPAPDDRHESREPAEPPAGSDTADESSDAEPSRTASDDPSEEIVDDNATMAIDISEHSGPIAVPAVDPVPGDETESGDDEADGDGADEENDGGEAADEPATSRSAPPKRRPSVPGQAKPTAPGPPDLSKEGRVSLQTALDENNTRAILQQLYQEITTTAEGMWSDTAPVLPVVWDRVRVSSWYENNFSKLGLKPVSDFYEVITSFYERLENGMSREEIQLFLKDCNFAHVLLALRDMFQRQQIQ